MSNVEAMAELISEALKTNNIDHDYYGGGEIAIYGNGGGYVGFVFTTKESVRLRLYQTDATKIFYEAEYGDLTNPNTDPTQAIAGLIDALKKNV